MYLDTSKSAVFTDGANRLSDHRPNPYDTIFITVGKSLRRLFFSFKR